MYAKLVVSTANGAYEFLRDIIRLVTATTPSTSLLSGSGFSTSASSMVDATPAGWTFVGSTLDGTTLGSGGGGATGYAAWNRWAISAPCASDASKLKYACFTKSSSFNTTLNTNNTNQVINMFGASSASSAGVLTNPGGHLESTSNAVLGLDASVGKTIHVIANPRHITIISDGGGMQAVWETTTTDPHTYYGIAPFVQYNHASSSLVTIATTVGAVTGAANTTWANAFNVTDVNTATVTGVLDLTAGTSLLNTFSLAQNLLASRTNAIDSAGNPKYQISPVFFQMSLQGYPVQYVTGVVPIYWCKAGLGNSGDTVNVGGVNYTYFNTGASGNAYGVLMLTN